LLALFSKKIVGYFTSQRPNHFGRVRSVRLIRLPCDADPENQQLFRELALEILKHSPALAFDAYYGMDLDAESQVEDSSMV
jgi:hypothetical protein